MSTKPHRPAENTTESSLMELDESALDGVDGGFAGEPFKVPPMSSAIGSGDLSAHATHGMKMEVIEYQDGTDLFLRKRPGRAK